MTRLVKLPQIQNVGSGQRATLRLPLGRTYNRIVLFTAGAINRGLFSNIVLKVNTGEKQRWRTSAQLQSLNSYKGGASDPAILELNFVENDAKDQAAMTLGAYALTAEAGVQDATLEFDIGAFTATANDRLVAFAEIDVPSANRLIVRTRYQQKTLAGAVEEPIILPYGITGEQIKRLHIFGTLAQIDHVRIRRDESDEWEELSVAQTEFFEKTNGKIPQAGHLVIDFVMHNLQSHMLNTAMILGANGQPRPVQNLDVRMKTNAAGTFDIYTESLALNDRP